MNIKRLPFTQRGIWNLVVLTLFVLLIAASTTYSIRAWRSTVFANQSPPSLVSTAQSATDGLAADSTTADFTVTGSYLGVVKVNEPVPLGDLDLLFDVVDSIGTLAGQVNSARTQVFLGGPTLTGSIDTSTSITPTFQLVSQEFDSVISGRTVRRRFTLTGEIINGGDLLTGDYIEVITGFKPQPMQVKGEFLVSRPSGTKKIIDNPSQDDPITPTATPTQPTPTAPAKATATPTLGTTPIATPTSGTTPVATPTPTSTRPSTGNDRPGTVRNAIFLPITLNSSTSLQSAGVMATQPDGTSTPTVKHRVDVSRQETIYLPVVVR